MGEAVLWGVVAASPLVVGAVLALWRRWPPLLLGLVLGFGAGALVSSIAFDLWEDGIAAGGAMPVVIGLAAGALCYYLADRAVARRAASTGGQGMPLALGALLDGIPEQLVLGIGIASGDGVGIALIIAIVVSNLPESIGSAADLLGEGVARARIFLMWVVVAAVCVLATIGGYALADTVSVEVGAGVNGFAAGALLVMLVDSMIPDAQQKAKENTGLATVLGFAVAAGLSSVA